MKKVLAVILALAGFTLAQTPLPPSTPCTAPVTPEDARACIMLQVGWLSSIDANAFVAISIRFARDESMMTTINGNQVSAQNQIDSLNVSSAQFSKDSAALQLTTNDLKTRVATLEAQLSALPNLSLGPLISTPNAVPSTGAATISWTNYTAGNGAILWSTALNAQNPSSAYTFPPQVGMGFIWTITAPSGTVISYWVKLYLPEGHTFQTKKYTIKVL